MKPKYVSVVSISLLLLLHIVLTQQVVNAFFYEHYGRTIVFAGLNAAVFPLSLWVYRRDRRAEDAEEGGNAA